MIGYGLVQVFNSLEYHGYFGLAARRSYKLSYFCRNLFRGKKVVNLLNIVYHLLFREIFLGFTLLVHFIKGIFLAGVFKQLYGCSKGDKIGDFGHIYTVTIGIADLRGRRCYHDFFRAKPVEHADNTFLQGGSAHNGVVEHHQIVDTAAYSSIRNVVHMCHQVVALRILCDKSTEFDIFYCDLFNTGFQLKYLLQFFARNVLPRVQDFICFYPVANVIQFFSKSIKSG